MVKSNFCLWNKFIFIEFSNFFSLSILGYLVFYLPKFSYIKYRINSFFEPASKGNYQSQKATDAIVDGGFFGKGIGEGTLNTRVPEAHTDYVISVISEEFGVLLILLILLIFYQSYLEYLKKFQLKKKIVISLF